MATRRPRIGRGRGRRASTNEVEHEEQPAAGAAAAHPATSVAAAAAAIVGLSEPAGGAGVVRLSIGTSGSATHPESDPEAASNGSPVPGSRRDSSASLQGGIGDAERVGSATIDSHVEVRAVETDTSARAPTVRAPPVPPRTRRAEGTNPRSKRPRIVSNGIPTRFSGQTEASTAVLPRGRIGDALAQMSERWFDVRIPVEIARAGGRMHLSLDREEDAVMVTSMHKHRVLPRTGRRASHMLRRRMQWVLYRRVQSCYVEHMVSCGVGERLSQKDKVAKLVREALTLQVGGNSFFEEQENDHLSVESFTTYQQELVRFAVADHQKFRSPQLGCMKSCAKHLGWLSNDDLMRAMKQLPELDDDATEDKLTEYEKAVSICCYTASQIIFSNVPRKAREDSPYWSRKSHETCDVACRGARGGLRCCFAGHTNPGYYEAQEYPDGTPNFNAVPLSAELLFVARITHWYFREWLH